MKTLYIPSIEQADAQDEAARNVLVDLGILEETWEETKEGGYYDVDDDVAIKAIDALSLIGIDAECI